MTPKDEALESLKFWQDAEDQDAAHTEADEILCWLLRKLGHGDVVDEWSKLRNRAVEQDVSMWFEIYDAWGNKHLLERFTYQQAKAFCEKNEPPAGGSGPSPRYSILPARQS